VKKISPYKIIPIIDRVETKFNASWNYAKTVREACKSVGKKCVEPFNRAIEEFEKDLNEIWELLGFEGKLKLPRLKKATLREIGNFERELAPLIIWKLKWELLEIMKKEGESQKTS